MIQQQRRSLYLTAAALACLIIGGCERKAAEGNKAAGEILEGTTSDAMIATDQSRTAPPLAPRKAEAPETKGGKAKTKPGDAAAVASPTSEPIPTAETSPAAKPMASEPAT